MADFLLYYPPNSPKMKISKKWIKQLEISSFNISVPKSWSYASLFLRYDTWQDVIVIFHFGLFFTLLPLTDWKIKNSRKWKKGLEISSFYTIVPKIMIKCYTVPEICHMADVTYFSFWTIFCCYPPNSLKNQNFKKMKKKPGDIILHMCPKNYD